MRAGPLSADRDLSNRPWKGKKSLPPFSHLFLHLRRAVRGGSGQEGGEIGMQGGFRLCTKGQHLESGVELTQLLLQAGVGVGRRPRL